MLFKNSHWRFAFERNLAREARLLYVNNSGGTPDNSDPLANTENIAGAGLNPDGTPQSAESGDAETAPTTSPDSIQNETQASAQNLLAEEPTHIEQAPQKPFHIETVELAREVNSIFSDIEDNLKEEGVQEYIKKQSKMAQKMYDEVIQFVEVERNKIAGHLLHAETISEWLNGNLDNPDTFFITLSDAYRGEEGGEEKVQRMREVYNNNHAQISHWDELGAEEKTRIISALAQAGNIYGKLENIKAEMETYKETAEMHRDVIAIINGQHTAEMEMTKQLEGSHLKGIGAKGLLRGFYGEIGIEFYSPFEVWEAFKSLKENYIKAFKDKAQLKSAVFAKAIGGAVKFGPYGEEVNIALERDVEAKHASASKEHQESLETRNPSWKRLFEDGGELDELIHLGQRDKAVGVMEFAAKHGWLYDIDESGTLSPDRRTILGRSVRDICPKDWDEIRMDRFYDTLRAANMSGMNEEIEKNTKKVQGIENTPFFIQEIDNNLKDGNLWAAVGIADRAIDRGLKAEVSPWVMMTIMRHIRDNPVVRKHASLIFLDKIGKLAAYRSAFTTGLLQYDRPGLMKWIKSGQSSMRDIPALGEILTKLETDITNACETKPDDKDLDHAVAYVLSANLLDENAVNDLGLTSMKLKPNKAITIYSNRYTFYRTSDPVNEVNPAGPGLEKEDTDYVFQTTENQYGGELTYDKMFAVDGRGDFTLKDRVPEFVGQILKQYSVLSNAGMKEEAELFRWEIGNKLNKIIIKNALNDSRSGGTYLLTIRGHADVPFVGKYLLSTLIQEGFFNIDDIANTIITQQQGANTAVNLIRQIDADIAEEMQKAGKSGDKATYQKALNRLRPKIQRQFLKEKPTTVQRRNTGGSNS